MVFRKGATDFITKPIDENELYNKLMLHLNKNADLKTNTFDNNSGLEDLSAPLIDLSYLRWLLNNKN